MKTPIEAYCRMQANKDWNWKLYLDTRKRERKRNQKVELINLLKMGNNIHDVSVILGIEESEVRELMYSMKRRRSTDDKK